MLTEMAQLFQSLPKLSLMMEKINQVWSIVPYYKLDQLIAHCFRNNQGCYIQSLTATNPNS